MIFTLNLTHKKEVESYWTCGVHTRLDEYDRVKSGRILQMRKFDKGQRGPSKITRLDRISSDNK